MEFISYDFSSTSDQWRSQKEVASSSSAFAFALIKKEQAPFYRFTEYDGIEDPYLDTSTYILHKIEVHFQQKDTMSQKECAEYSRVEHEFIDTESTQSAVSEY